MVFGGSIYLKFALIIQLIPSHLTEQAVQPSCMFEHWKVFVVLSHLPEFCNS